MGEYITEDNRLSEWGGSDDWQYRWESENTDIVRDNQNINEGKKSLLKVYVCNISMGGVY